jgi:acetolactate synthase-1/2/3 large subunit
MDIDPASISKIVAADIPIVGPVDTALIEMERLIEAELGKHDELPDSDALASWWNQIDEWRESHGLNHDMLSSLDPGKVIRPQQVIQALYQVTQGEAYVSSDVGQHQMFAAQYYKFDEPRRWINSGGLGTMGFGLPAAMGVQFAFPHAVVACVTGEGSFMMNMQELSTCLQYALPIKIVNLNNAALGMVKQWQDMQYGGRHSHSTYRESLPNFVDLVASFGHVGIKVDTQGDLVPAMNEAFGSKYKDKLVFLDVDVDPEEHVYPMAIKGGSMRDMFLARSDAC